MPVAELVGINDGIFSQIPLTMKINGPTPPSRSTPLARSPQAVVDAWQVGQIVRATAGRPRGDGRLTVNIGNLSLLASSPVPLSAGQPLKLEVTSLAEMAVLRLLDSAGRPTGVELRLPPPAPLLQALQAGKSLEAVIPRAPEPGRSLALEIAGTRVSAKATQPLPAGLAAGQAVRLEVISAGAPATLRILDTANRADMLSRAIRNDLPRQAPLAPLLANLAWVARGPRLSADARSETTPGQPAQQAPATRLPAALVNLARDLLQHLPSRDDIRSARGLAQAVTQSGVFRESSLAQAAAAARLTSAATPSAAPLPTDFKSDLAGLLVLLLRLVKAAPAQNTGAPRATAGAIPPPLPGIPLQPQAAARPGLNPQMGLMQVLFELMRNVEGGLARIRLHQFVASAAEDDGKRSQMLEIPVRADDRIDVIPLRIEREDAARKHDERPAWTVNLALDLPGLGPVQARVSLADGRIGTTFWSERPDTRKHIGEHLPELRRSLQAAGLVVGALSALPGRPPGQPANPDTPMHKLLDEQA